MTDESVVLPSERKKRADIPRPDTVYGILKIKNILAQGH